MRDSFVWMTESSRIIAVRRPISVWRRSRARCWSYCLLASVFMASGVSAQMILPTAKVLKAERVNPASANTWYGSSTTHTPGAGAPSTRPPELKELARALRNDPDLIYQFVRNHVAVEFRYGVSKGALGALIDRSGTPFDQAILMVELLREAGITARYHAGTITLNATQFEQWTGVTNAKAACELLAAGGIPATVNGSSSAACAISGNVTSVVLSHAWAGAQIGGTWYAFDPSYKPHAWHQGLSLTAEMGFSAGAAYSAASSGLQSGTQSGVPYIRNLHTENLDTTLQDWSETLLTSLRSNYFSKPMEDVVGGRTIERYEIPAGGLRQTALPFSPVVQRTWTGNVPDQYRTTLRAEVAHAHAPTNKIIDQTFYIDQIYGRRLGLDSNFDAQSITQSSHYNNSFKMKLMLDDRLVVEHTSSTHTIANVNHMFIWLTANHPYAASAGGGALDGSYGDRSIQRLAGPRLPIAILHGWGDTGSELLAKWSSERVEDKALHRPVSVGWAGCDLCIPSYPSPAGDFSRQKTAASWLAQFTKMSQLIEPLGAVRVSHHSTIGLVMSPHKVQELMPVPGNPQSYPPDYTISDTAEIIDVEPAYSVTSTAADTNKRNAAAKVVAAGAAALEGSVQQQNTDSPDVAASTVRFAWGNRPEAAEDTHAPTGTGARRFYTYSTPSHVSAADGVTLFEGRVTPASGPPGQTDGDNFKNVLTNAIDQYVDAGYSVTASAESFLGPGKRFGGYNVWNCAQPGDMAIYCVDAPPTLARGGALVATRMVSGDVTEIAHVLTNPFFTAKGGGVADDPGREQVWNPAEAADVLKDKFVDRSSALGVDVRRGQPAASTPALAIGSGEFPQQLSAQLLYRGVAGETETFAHNPRAGSWTAKGWTNNWDIQFSLSSSAMESMGESSPLAATRAIAALKAALDIQAGTTNLPTRDVATMLALDWWMSGVTGTPGLQGNVGTVRHGLDAMQFVRLADGTFMPPPGRGALKFEQTGARSKERYVCTTSGTNPATNPEALSRGWVGENVTFKLTHSGGDEMSFGWYEVAYGPGGYNGPSMQIPPCERNLGYRITGWSFPFGPALTFQHNGDLVTRVTNAVGRYVQLASDSVADSQSRTMSFNSSGVWTDLTGGQWKYQQANPVPVSDTVRPTPYGRLTKVFEPVNTSQAALEYIYDATGRVKEAKDAVAIQTPASRDPYKFYLAPGARAEREDPLGNRYVVDFDTEGRAIHHIDELGRKVVSAYDGRGRVTSRIWPELDETRFQYDARDNVTELRRKAKPASGLADLVVEAAWHADFNKPLWIKDAKGLQTDFEYYLSGNGKSLLKVAKRPLVDGARPEYNFTYNNRGQVLTAKDPTNLQTNHTYHASNGNRLTTVTAFGTAMASATTFGYDAIGNPTSAVDARGNATTYVYDASRRPTQTKHHNGGTGAALLAAERTTYDLNGRVTKEDAGTAFSGTSVSTWQMVRELTYTKTSQVLTEKNGAGNTTTFAYDGVDRVLERADPLNRRTRFAYDAAGQLLTETRAYGTPLSQPYARYTYSANGQPLTLRDAKNNRSTYEYDGFDRLVKWLFPVEQAGEDESSQTDYEEYGYDANGNRISIRKRDARRIDFEYDALNRETRKFYPNGGATQVYRKYDLAGRPEWVKFDSAGGQGIVYAYNAAKLLQSESSFGRAVSFQYDAVYNRTRVTYPDSQYMVYVYDALNRVTHVRENGATSGVGQLAVYSYDPHSRRTNLSRGNSTTTAYGYDLASRLTSLNQNLGGTTHDAVFSLGYSPAGQLASRQSSNGLLGGWTVPSRTETYAAANGLNQYTTVASRTYTHDANGNLTSNGLRTYSYDVENRLTSVSGSPATNLTYDPLGRLRQTVAGSVTTQFLYDGDRLIAEYNGSGTLLRRYVHGPGIDEPIVWYEGTGLTNRRWLHADERGSVIAETNGSGTATPYSYGAFGEPSSWTGSRFRYTGQIMLPEAQLYHYKARVYDPIDGRFLQTDPIGYEDDINLYAYVANDPTNATDPYGLCKAGCRTRSNPNRPPIPGPMPRNPVIGPLIDFTPGLGDAKGVVEAYRDPTPINILAAGIGLIPIIGDFGKGVLKSADEVFEVLSDGAPLATNDALDAAAAILGKDYTEVTSGVFRSADGNYQVRMTDSDLAGKGTGSVPHLNVERGSTVTTPSGRTRFNVEENKHILLPQEQP